MQTILVPTDFSPASISVLPIAAEIAHKGHDRIGMLHAYGEIGQDEKKERELSLERLKMLIDIHDLTDYPHRCFVRIGDCVSAIENLLRLIDVSMIVMSHSGESEDKITSTIVHRAEIPVLTVPRHNEIEGIKRILYASDTLTDEQNIAYRAIEFASLVNAEISFVAVCRPDASLEKIEETSMLLRRLKRLSRRVSTELITGEDIDNITEQLMTEQNADLFAVGKPKSGWFGRIEKEERIEYLLSQQKFPVLFLPDEGLKKRIKSKVKKEEELLPL